jgi:hypothetical protein
MIIRWLCGFLLFGVASAQFGSGSSSSSLLLRSLVESLERNMVSKIEHVERTLRSELLEFGDRLSEVQLRVAALERADGDVGVKIKENTARLDSFDAKIQASTARIGNQFADNLNIVGMSLTQLR